MNQKQRKEFYPAISINSKDRCEQRWEDCANAYGDIIAEWQISIGNGKRLYRQWKKCCGVKAVQNEYGEWLQITNDDWILRPTKFKRQTAMSYDMALQPDGNYDFFTSQ